MTTKLRSCPFCGSDNLDDTCADRGKDTREFYFVFCDRCEANGPTSYEREKAVEMWNRRRESDNEY